MISINFLKGIVHPNENSVINYSQSFVDYLFSVKRMIMLFFLYNESERSLQKWQINHHISGAYVAQIDISYSTFVLFDTIHFIV